VGISPETQATLQWVGDDFDVLTRGVSPNELLAPTNGTKWTNRELLFHMWFGQRLTRTLLPVVRGFSRLPPSASAAFSGLLTTATRPYEWANYAASAGGGRVVQLERVRHWMHRDTAAILQWSAQANDVLLDRGMSIPSEWDPYFMTWMSCRDVLEWAPRHYRHHRAQLTIRGATG